FPDAIAAKAMPKLAACGGVRAPAFDGTAAGLTAAMDRAGIGRCVVANIATNPRQQRPVNDFAISLLGNGRFIPFGSVHPDSPDALDELLRLKNAGIKGIKLHPDYQAFFADEPRVFPIYREAARLGLITLFHAGVDIGLCDPVRCTPARLRAALPQFEGAPVVAAHFGGYLLWREVLEQLCRRDVWFDTSYCAGKMPPPWAREIVEAHGAERILFGTDLPWVNPLDEIEFARTLSGDEEIAGGILGGNAAKLLQWEGSQ
ncbi:MAG: amidohydrolase family protein, partial [Firmicutes bacterium]|nr:amidohydrolase family protein [Bacillota bacterium]